ncbi:hypothetical protein [Aliidiomarina soli]|uniref:PepSY domain-containing protein n=1 Tax=Aliidiomarina soli TaxID=1928574 RepID=A0A432WGQ4_9GAMM|nr:hypothetical protein [Aliidiomarina soli]RUO32925.1 hypothetical protein CWE14_06665 [Aliidiomarina soli]
MMKAKSILAGAVAMGLMVSAPVLADDHGKVNDWLDDYGFSHVTEVEWKSGDRVEVEGFARDGMHSEVVFNADGDVHQEEHERYSRDAWGLDLSQLQKAMDKGKEGGIHRFDEIAVSSNGEVEVEGYDQDGSEVEIKLQLDELS